MFQSANSQPVKAWVYFKDKDTTGFRMEDHFDPMVMYYRSLQQLPVWDMYDVPVTVAYEKQVTAFCDSVIVVSRWMNGMAVWSDTQRLKTIASLSFVSAVDEVNEFPEGGICEVNADDYELRWLPEARKQLLKGQTAHLQGKKFRLAGINGKGMRVAVIDAGFKGVSNSEGLKHLRYQGRILHTHDYVRRKTDVEHGSRHGTAVLSCIAGMLDSTCMGLAPAAEFLLYRTEKVFNEKFNEEEYWLAAAEEAEKRGARIINTSLGYTGRRYFRKDMDGKHSLLARATSIVARKGVLVVCSAGNEGTNYWRMIVTPADADSVLAVGGINPWTGVHTEWSSVGPSYDKRVKPNVCAYAFVVGDDAHGGLYEVPGTSFSSPLVAGFATCVLQMHPEYNVKQLITEIEKSGHLYPYFDYAHGYGVPQAGYFTDAQDTLVPTFEITETPDSIRILINQDCFRPAYVSASGYNTEYVPTLDEDESERDSYHISEFNYNSGSSVIHTQEPGYFYYGLMNDQNYLDWYYVLNVRQRNVVSISKLQLSGKARFVFHYRGYSTEWPVR